MSQVRYQPLGSPLGGEGSRTFLALALEEGAQPRPVVLVGAPPEISQDPERVSRLQRETQRAVVFEHPNILRVFGLVALESGIVARVTEFADGEPLRRVLNTCQKLPPALAALVAADVARGVHYAHMAGNDDGSPLVHGDLSPETVMVSFKGVCKVAGYGALSVAPQLRNTRAGRNRRLYSAPEQLTGGRAAASVLTDVFLLGLLLHECLTGRKPFQDALDADKAILTHSLPFPADVPRPLNEVVRRATSKRADDRYPSAMAFREAVVAALGTELPSAEAFAVFLGQLFPPDSGSRAQLRKALEAGINAAMQGDLRISSSGIPLVAAAPAAAPALSRAIETVSPGSAYVPPRPSLGGIPAVPVAPQAPVIASPPPVSQVTAPAPVITTAPPNSKVTAPAPVIATAPPNSRVTGSTPAIASAPPGPRMSGSAPVITSPPPVSQVTAPAPVIASAPPVSQVTAPAPVIASPAPISQVTVQAPIIASAPPVSQVTAPAPVVASEAPVPPSAAPAPPASVPPPEAVDSAPPPARAASRGRSPMLLAAAVLLIVSGLGVVFMRGSRGAPDVSVFEDAGTPDASVPVEPVDAGRVIPDAGAPRLAPPPPAPTQVQLFVEPAVDVAIDGKAFGRAPVTVPLPLGRFMVTMTDPEKGLRTSRMIDVTHDGTASFHIRLGMGSVLVKAPVGALLSIDGREVGTAPRSEITQFEGEHHLLVTQNDSRWEKDFVLGPDQRLVFAVDFDANPAGPTESAEPASP